MGRPSVRKSGKLLSKLQELVLSFGVGPVNRSLELRGGRKIAFKILCSIVHLTICHWYSSSERKNAKCFNVLPIFENEGAVEIENFYN